MAGNCTTTTTTTTTTTQCCPISDEVLRGSDVSSLTPKETVSKMAGNCDNCKCGDNCSCGSGCNCNSTYLTNYGGCGCENGEACSCGTYCYCGDR